MHITLCITTGDREAASARYRDMKRGCYDEGAGLVEPSCVKAKRRYSYCALPQYEKEVTLCRKGVIVYEGPAWFALPNCATQ